MALIKCPECEHEVSDKATMCPNCGCPIKGRKEIIPIDIATLFNRYRKILIPIIAVIAILVVVLVSNGALDENEKLAYECAVEMKSLLKDPNSFQLYDEMIVLKCFGDDGHLIRTYTVFKYGGTNSYGATVTDRAIFIDGEYVTDFSDKVDKDDDIKDSFEKTFAKFGVETGLQADEDDDGWERIDIDVSRIKAKMGLK